MIQLAPQLPMSQQGTYQEHTLGINTVPRPVAGRFNAPHRHLPARPGDLSRHHAARDPPAGPGDDGERAEISPKGMGQSQEHLFSGIPARWRSGTAWSRRPCQTERARLPGKGGRDRSTHQPASIRPISSCSCRPLPRTRRQPPCPLSHRRPAVRRRHRAAGSGLRLARPCTSPRRFSSRPD